MSCDSTSAKLNFYIDNRALGFLKARNQIIIEVRIMTKVQLNVWSNVQQRRKIYRQDIKFVWMEKYLRRECIYEYFLWRRSGGWVGWYYDGSAGDIIHSGINYYYYFIIIIILILLLFTVFHFSFNKWKTTKWNGSCCIYVCAFPHELFKQPNHLF